MPLSFVRVCYSKMLLLGKRRPVMLLRRCDDPRAKIPRSDRPSPPPGPSSLSAITVSPLASPASPSSDRASTTSFCISPLQAVSPSTTPPAETTGLGSTQVTQSQMITSTIRQPQNVIQQ